MSGSYECGVCWWVYDPAAGDERGQVPRGTPFEALPATWTCPTCDGDGDAFLPLAADGRTAPSAAAGVPSGAGVRQGGLGRLRDQRLSLLLDDYREVLDSKMAGLPIVNAKLEVAAVAFAPRGDGQLGIVITPWLLSAVWLPDAEDPSRRAGDPAPWDLPSGRYEAVVGRLPRVGAFESLSLLSPVEMLTDMSVAREAARAAHAELLAPAPVPGRMSRRGLFTGSAGRR